MTKVDIALQILLLVFGVFLVVAVLLQKSKSQGLSGTIQGGAETFYGKGMGGKSDKILSIATAVIGVIFVLLAIVVYCKQTTYSGSDMTWDQIKDILGK